MQGAGKQISWQYGKAFSMLSSTQHTRRQYPLYTCLLPWFWTLFLRFLVLCLVFQPSQRNYNLSVSSQWVHLYLIQAHFCCLQIRDTDSNVYRYKHQVLGFYSTYSLWGVSKQVLMAALDSTKQNFAKNGAVEWVACLAMQRPWDRKADHLVLM